MDSTPLFIYLLSNKEHSPDLQMKSVKEDVNNIKYINNPTEEVQKYVLDQNPKFIIYFHSKKYNDNFKYMKNYYDEIDIDYNNFKYMKNIPKSVLFEIYNTFPDLQLYIELSKEEQLEIIDNCESEPIEYMNITSEDVKLAVVKKDGLNIKYIKNPSLKIQKAAINENIHSFSDIINPSKEFIQYALDNWPGVIQYIKKPTKEQQMLVVTKYINNYRYIKNPSPNVRRFVCQNDGIEYIDNPTKEEQMIAIKNSPFVCILHNITNPTEEAIFASISINGYEAMKNISNPTDKMKYEAVKNCSLAISLIKKPSYELQKMAIDDDINNIIYIDNLHEDIKSQYSYNE